MVVWILFLVVHQLYIMVVFMEHVFGFVVVFDELDNLCLELFLNQVFLPLKSFQFKLYDVVDLWQLHAPFPELLELLLSLLIHALRPSHYFSFHLRILPLHTLTFPPQSFILPLKHLYTLKILPNLLLIIPYDHLLAHWSLWTAWHDLRDFRLVGEDVLS